MNDDRLHDETELASAFRSVRETYDGAHETPNLTLQRALFRTRTRERKQRFARWVLVPIAAALVASTAWAEVTGRLTPAVSSVLDALYAERSAPSSVNATASAPEHVLPRSDGDVGTTVLPKAEEIPLPTSQPESSPPATLRREPVRAPAPSITSQTPPQTPPWGSVRDTPEPATSSSAGATAPSDPNTALFAEAHRRHFVERDPERALEAWDRYLAAAPNGRFAPEARYNRALTLLRMGRNVEAKRELELFANGVYGTYRQVEAHALLEALDRDASLP